MNDEQFRQDIQIIYQQMAVLRSIMTQLSSPQRKQVAEVLEEITAAFGNLQLIWEEMQTSLEASDVVAEELLQQNQQAIAERQYYYNLSRYYYDLLQFCPEAYLVTDAKGLILEANQAIAKLLNVPQRYLVNQPLAAFVADADRRRLGNKLKKLSSASDVQNWKISLCPKQGEPFAALLKVAIARDWCGQIEALRIGVHDMSRSQQKLAQVAGQLNEEDISAQVTASTPSLPQALDGLRVLVVDDEADAREFITAVLESHGIRVIAVATAVAALEALERFHPNVLMSDIRMPYENGYSLIRKVRELEAKHGWHIPAAALTAYLEEDREKALAAGFESHLHKLAQPTELIEMVTRLAGRASKSE